MNRTLGITLTLATTALGLIGLASTASAAVVSHTTTHQVSDQVDTECGFDIPFHDDLVLNSVVKTHGTDTPTLESDSFNETGVFTNTDTDKTFTVRSVGMTKDLKVVDNGDGTLSFVDLLVGSEWVYGPDGALLFADHGAERAVGIFDPAATPPVTIISDSLAGPHPIVGRDFCADFLTYTS